MDQFKGEVADKDTADVQRAFNSEFGMMPLQGMFDDREAKPRPPRFPGSPDINTIKTFR
jgi:hypothetical protein